MLASSSFGSSDIDMKLETKAVAAKLRGKDLIGFDTREWTPASGGTLDGAQSCSAEMSEPRTALAAKVGSKAGAKTGPATVAAKVGSKSGLKPGASIRAKVGAKVGGKPVRKMGTSI